MLAKLLLAFGLMALCVVVHAIGLMSISRWVDAQLVHAGHGLRYSASRLIRVAGWTVLLHLSQILVWAVAYAGSGAMPDFTAAAYFSAVTYTTTGYGDLVLPADWRVVGGIEALTGILMCGLSTGMYFVVFSKFFGRDSA